MAIKLDELEINILVNYSKAKSEISKLGNSFRKTSKELKNLGDHAKSSSSKLGNLFSSFKRIAMYRAMRSAIKAITEAFSEGIENLKAWDLLIANTSYANNTMNMLKATTTQLANTLGALAIPIIQIAIPAIQALANVVMKVANFFNQVIRAFQGFNTYIKATTLSIEAMNDTLGNAGTAAKELKRVLFGFDELNVLQNPKDGGGGGGAGSLWDLADMFEETALESTLATKIGSVMAKVKDYLKPYFTDIWSGLKTTASGLGKAVAGLISGDFNMAWEGLKESWSGFKFVVKTVVDLGKDIKTKFDGIKLTIAKAFQSAYSSAKAYFFTPAKIALDAFLKSLKVGIEFILNPLKWNKEGWSQLKSDIAQIWVDAFEQTKAEQDNFIIKEVKAAFATARVAAGKEKPVGLGTAFTMPSNAKKTYKYALAQIGKLGAIDMKTKLLSVTNSKSVVNSAQKSVNKLNPITISLAIGTDGLAGALATVWKAMQNAANENPVTFPTGVTTATSNPVGTDVTQRFAMTFAKGGTIPNTGSLFIAGERGAEVVADMGSHTGVMNVSQMQEAVASGNVEVINAIYGMANMVVNAVNNKSLDVYMDSAKVGRSVSSYQFNQARRGIQTASSSMGV